MVGKERGRIPTPFGGVSCSSLERGLGASQLRESSGAARVSTRQGYARFRSPEGQPRSGTDGRMNIRDNRSLLLLQCCGTAVFVAFLHLATKHLATSVPLWQMERL